MVIAEMKAMLDVFLEHVPDKESNRLVWKFCDERHRWSKAQGLHGTLRERNLAATRRRDRIAEAQYCFEEVCAKTLYNLTRLGAPFDPDAPYWVIKNALALAKRLEIPCEEIVCIVAPSETDSFKP